MYLSPLLVGCMLAGCAPRTFEDPVVVLLDRKAGYNFRRAAMAQARTQMPRDPRRIEALEKVLWQHGYPAWQRVQAIDDLIAYDEQAFCESLPRRFGLLNDWGPINHIFDLAIERQWPDFTPVVVRNYARHSHGMADTDRPERRVIAALHPGRPIENVIFEVFADTDASQSARDQVAAWELLARLCDRQTLRGHLSKAAGTTPLVIDLKAAAADLHVLPVNKEGILWLQWLRDADRKARWDRLAAAAGELDDPRRAGLAIRHLPLLAMLDSHERGRSRQELAAQLDSYTRGADRHMTSPTFDGGARDWDQTFYHWQPKLHWGDLMVLDAITTAMKDRSFVAALFEQADRDLENTATEYGGVIELDHSADGRVRFAAKEYRPRFTHHDRKYVPSPEMIESLYTNLAHYHFHAQAHKNGDYAGPGAGDLQLADRLDASFVVFTFIDEHRLNVDYYQRGRMVVDLGTIRR